MKGRQFLHVVLECRLRGGSGGERTDRNPKLAGCHRFARYVLTFGLTDAAGAATHMRAQTCALFPGARGQAHRTLVIGTRAHMEATTHILRSVRRLSLAPA